MGPGLRRIVDLNAYRAGRGTRTGAVRYLAATVIREAVCRRGSLSPRHIASLGKVRRPGNRRGIGSRLLEALLVPHHAHIDGQARKAIKTPIAKAVVSNTCPSSFLRAIALMRCVDPTLIASSTVDMVSEKGGKKMACQWSGSHTQAVSA